jgi:2-polyprenyl-6-methoxyphenol hydroxylase-like FAD-dependent oxidoreductase
MELALIAGAGIGGLTPRGQAFAARHPALVVEQAERLAPVGAGLTVQPNAVLALRRLDLSKPLEAAGVPLSAGSTDAWRTAAARNRASKRVHAGQRG